MLPHLSLSFEGSIHVLGKYLGLSPRGCGPGTGGALGGGVHKECVGPVCSPLRLKSLTGTTLSFSPQGFVVEI